MKIIWPTLNDLKGQYRNRNCIGCSVSSRARRFYCEKYLQNLRPIFSLFIYSAAVYVTWRDDHVHETTADKSLSLRDWNSNAGLRT